MREAVAKTRVLFALLVLGAATAARAQEQSDFPVNTVHIVYHDVRTDREGKIVPWYSDRSSIAFDHDIRLIWNFWQGMRDCPNGVPYYLQHQVWKEKQDDERGLGGDQINMALDSWNLLYGYLGDEDLHRNMREMADYWLNHGMSSSSLLYGNLPYPYNLDVHSGRYDGDMRAGKGFLQPDKAASFGTQLIVLFKITGDRRYLNASRQIADSLAARVIAGDASHSPWPFRVNAATGKVAEDPRPDGPHDAAYTTNWTPALELFDGLIQLHEGDCERYAHARDLVVYWLKEYPLKTNKWGPFFEDIPTADYSDTEINADTMAAYLLNHPEFDPQAAEMAKGILDWSYSTLGNHDFEKLHVVPINEQTRYLIPGNSHTSRHASVELLLCEKTGNCPQRDEIIRRLNWATYSVNDDGKNRYPNDDIWLTDGYGDYVRHYLRAMAVLPELAPEDQNHLLRTTSVIQEIEYGTGRISYRKFDAVSRESFKIGEVKPIKVVGGKMSWNDETKVLSVQATTRVVTIELSKR
jgi:hypothetical protein